MEKSVSTLIWCVCEWSFFVPTYFQCKFRSQCRQYTTTWKRFLFISCDLILFSMQYLFTCTWVSEIIYKYQESWRSHCEFLEEIRMTVDLQSKQKGKTRSVCTLYPGLGTRNLTEDEIDKICLSNSIFCKFWKLVRESFEGLA